MIEDEALVWYEADGTRHVLGEPPATVEAAEPAPVADVADPVEWVAPAVEADADELDADEAIDEPSALRGMVRALALGAAAAAATGAAVGAISLAATGDRPDTSVETLPSTLVVGGDPTVPVPTTEEVERIELVPPTTSADQPG